MDFGWKLEYLVRIHAWTRRTSQVHKERPEFQPRTFFFFVSTMSAKCINVRHSFSYILRTQNFRLTGILALTSSELRNEQISWWFAAVRSLKWFIQMNKLFIKDTMWHSLFRKYETKICKEHFFILSNVKKARWLTNSTAYMDLKWSLIGWLGTEHYGLA